MSQNCSCSSSSTQSTGIGSFRVDFADPQVGQTLACLPDFFTVVRYLVPQSLQVTETTAFAMAKKNLLRLEWAAEMAAVTVT